MRTVMMIVLLLQLLAAQSAAAAPPYDPVVPFAVGESLEYDVKVPLLGRVGRALLTVDVPCEPGLDGALLLSSSVDGGAAFMRVSDRTRSWIDARTFATVRYEKRESSPLGTHEESVVVQADARRWRNEAGDAHPLAAAVPLDELSLIYYLRALPLNGEPLPPAAGHFDEQRNPITLRLLGRRTIRVAAGRFDVAEVELTVRDPRRYSGTGTVRIALSDDARRLPVRIRTSLPGSSAVTLELRSVGRSDDVPPSSCL